MYKRQVKARSTDSGYFSYEISNQKANPIVEKNGHILSDKKDAKSHGLGIRNIREIIDRYNGTLDISYTEVFLATGSLIFREASMALSRVLENKEQRLTESMRCV